jgi:allophanate hydrolase
MSARDALAASTERIAACDDGAIVIATVDAGRLAELADEIDRRPAVEVPLRGTTFVVKDNIDVAGAPTTAACPAIAYVPERSATVVDRLIAAGALPVAKVNLDQFATGLVGTRSPYGTPRNPIRADLVPGGSSSGSGVAVARGLSSFALGTDTAGSGRVPAAMCGIVGIKPTPGWLSGAGVIPAVRSVDCVSVFAGDLALGSRAVDAAAGFDPADPYSRRAGDPAGPVRRIGVVSPEHLESLGIATHLLAGYVQALDALTARGFELHEFDPAALYAIGDQLYGGPWVSERLVTLDRYAVPDGALDPTVAMILTGARRYTAADVHEAQYAVASLRHLVDTMFRSFAAIAMPTVGWHVTLAEVDADPIGANTKLGRFTTFTNLAGLAAVTFPMPSGESDGLPPFSLTLHGPPWSDHALIEAAALATDVPVELPDQPGSIVLAVAGAHLRGEALDHQLVDRGARFVGTTRTAACYRLYAIADTAPPKPALVHIGPSEGASIEVDLWSVSPAALGGFVASIPPPLGIGTVELADGRHVTGFIAEPRALDGAADITHHGGWRAYRSTTT